MPSPFTAVEFTSKDFVVVEVADWIEELCFCVLMCNV
jgi:thermostable 8-oxoguanine DNA glycosylase